MIETERRNRIRLCLAAYAYEIGEEFMTDSEWDKLALSINTNIKTNHAVMDKFFQEVFVPYTSSWIRLHPEYNKLIGLYNYLKLYYNEHK